MSARPSKSIFTRKPDEKETVNFRLPAGTRERITAVNTRLREQDPQLNFDLAVVVEDTVERGLSRAERELEEMEVEREQTEGGTAISGEDEGAAPDERAGATAEPANGGARGEKMSSSTVA